MAKLDVRVFPLENQPENSTKAFASVTIEDLVAIKGIRIVEGSKGHFVTMPQSKDKDGNFHDIAFPVTGDLRKAMNKAILDEFKEVTKSAEKSADKTADKAPDKTAGKAPDKTAGKSTAIKETHDDPEM